MKKSELYLSISIVIVCILVIYSLPCRAASLTDDIRQFQDDNPQGYANLCWSAAVFYHQSGNTPKALDWVERILEVQPQNNDIKYYKAQLLFSLGRYADCEGILEVLEKTPELKDAPLLVSVRGLLYQTYKASGKLPEKTKEIEGKLKARRPDVDTFRRAFMLYRADEAYDKTIELAKKAIKAYPEESSFRFAITYAYEKKGLLNEALQEYKSASEKLPKNPAIASRLVDLAIQLGLFEEAAVELKRIEKAFVGNPQMLARVKRSRAAIAQARAVKK